jgi:hypothetical protein
MTDQCPYHYHCLTCTIKFSTAEPVIGAGHRCKGTLKETPFVLEKRKPTRGKGVTRAAG